MLRHTMIISTCLLLLGISCSRAKQHQTDTENPVDPNASRIATMQAQLDAQTKQIQEMLRKDQDKQTELMQLRAELADERTPRDKKEAILRKLEEWGVIDTAVQVGTKAVTTWLDRLLDNTPPPTEPAPSGQ